MKYIHNISESEKTYMGITIDAGTFYQIPNQSLGAFQASTTLVSDVASGAVSMSANGTSDISGSTAAHVAFLLDNDLPPRDSDGSPIQRVKVTNTGWSYQLHGMEFVTSDLSSVFSKNHNGDSYGFAALRLYNAGGEEITEPASEGTATKTVVDWEPTFDYEVIGGMLKFLTIPASDAHLWVVGVPDIPEGYGGSKLFVSSVNIRFLGTEEGIRVDGRSSKLLQYSSENHTNKIRLIITHEAGVSIPVHLIMEIFKV